MKILCIADCPHLLETVVDWERGEWGDEWAELAMSATARDRVPTTYVALDGNEIVGCVMFVKYDMMTRKDLTPWLGGLFVPPKFRGRGIATKLVDHVLLKAKDVGIGTLWLYTSSSRNLYARIGWMFVEELEYMDEIVTLMRYDFPN